MAAQLSAGKWQRLRSLTDEQGRFTMMAIDQRDSLRRAIACAQPALPWFRHRRFGGLEAMEPVRQGERWYAGY